MPGTKHRSKYPPEPYITKIIGGTRGPGCWWAVYKLIEYDEGYTYRKAERAVRECIKSDEAADG